MDATSPVLALPEPHVHHTALALRRAASHAEWAVQLLQVFPDPSALGDGNPATVLTDAAGLAHGMARLDDVLGPRLLAASMEPGVPTEHARVLRWKVATDCRMMTHLGVGSASRKLIELLHQQWSPDRPADPDVGVNAAPAAPDRLPRLCQLCRLRRRPLHRRLSWHRRRPRWRATSPGSPAAAASSPAWT